MKRGGDHTDETDETKKEEGTEGLPKKGQERAPSTGSQDERSEAPMSFQLDEIKIVRFENALASSSPSQRGRKKTVSQETPQADQLDPDPSSSPLLPPSIPSFQKRVERNLDILKRMREGDPLRAFDSSASWFPPRPKITKDPQAIEKLYGEGTGPSEKNTKKNP